jgi:tetratricopeptide (TPR) repeat protein
MKKYALTLALMVSVTLLFAQTIDQAKSLLKENKLVEAKTEIDKILALQTFQKSADAWYVKAKIYTAISQDVNLRSQFPAARLDAFNALKKYTEVDDKMLIALQVDGYKPINEIYTGFYQEAANSFNAKNYENALRDFTHAIDVSKFMTAKGWISLALDTNSVLYAGVAAEKLGKLDEAVKHYGRLVEGRVKGDGYVEIYKWAANYYFEKKNYSQAVKMLGIGIEIYPGDPFWVSIELDMTRETGTKDQLFSKYEAIIASEPVNHLYRYNYAIELYQYGYHVDPAKRPANSQQLLKKADEQIKQVVKLVPEYSKGLLFAGQLEYNRGIDKLKTNKEEAIKNFDAAIPYFVQLEKILAPRGKLSQGDKSDLKEALDLLITIYDQKKMADKVKEYEVKFNEVDKKH